MGGMSNARTVERSDRVFRWTGWRLVLKARSNDTSGVLPRSRTVLSGL